MIGGMARALAALLLLAGGCSYLEDERLEVRDAPGRTGEMQVVIFVMSAPTPDSPGEYFACVYRPIDVPAAAECDLVVGGTRSVIAYHAGEKALCLPMGLLWLVATPVAIPVGIVLALKGDDVGHVHPLWLPVLTLMAGGYNLGSFLWFFQALPPLDRRAGVDEPMAEHVRRLPLPAGTYSLPVSGSTVTVRGKGLLIDFPTVTGRAGWAVAEAAAVGRAVVGARIDVEIRLPGAAPVRRTVTMLAWDPEILDRVPPRLALDERGGVTPRPHTVYDVFDNP